MHTTHKTGPLGLPTPRRTTLGPKKDLEMLRLTWRDQGRKGKRVGDKRESDGND